MGYFQNLEIALQTEEADRIPRPVPATQHHSYPTRRSIREIKRRANQYRMTRIQDEIAKAVVYSVTALVIGFGIGAVIL